MLTVASQSKINEAELSPKAQRPQALAGECVRNGLGDQRKVKAL